MRQPLFVTATGTADGKTHITRALLRAAQSIGLSAVGFKPICCGDRDDAENLLAASSPGARIDDVNPVWFRPPLAPYVAGMIEERITDLSAIHSALERLQAQFDCVIIEGAGGLLVPIRADYSMADLAKELGSALLLVVPNRLGCINHALLTVEAIHAHSIPLLGWILNEPSAPDPEHDPSVMTNGPILEELLRPVPLLGEYAFGDLQSPPPPKLLEMLRGLSAQ
jgi:dethiobiotin synthetase